MRKLMATAALPALALFASCASAPPPSPWEAPVEDERVVERSLDSMGARFRIRAWKAKKGAAVDPRVFETAFAQVRRVAKLVDGNIKGSEIAKVNAGASGKAVRVSHEVFELLKLGQDLNQKSDGVFDITFARIQEANEKDDPNAGLKAGVLESASDVAREMKSRVGARNLVLDGSRLEVKFSRPGLKLSVMGLARGYAAQRAAETLGSAGLAGFAVLVDGSGGDVLAASGAALKDPKLMCVEHPNQLGTCAYRIQQKSGHAVLYLSQSSVADRPGHVYDAKSGQRKARSGAVTVIGAQGAVVQAASVAAGAMDNKAAGKFLSSLGGLGAAGVYYANDFGVVLSGSLEPFAKAEPLAGTGVAPQPAP